MTPADIKAFRGRHHVLQRELADRLGVSTRIVQAWENGARNPSPYLGLALQALGGILDEERKVAKSARKSLITDLLPPNVEVALFRRGADGAVGEVLIDWQRPEALVVKDGVNLCLAVSKAARFDRTWVLARVDGEEVLRAQEGDDGLFREIKPTNKFNISLLYANA